MNLVKLGAFRKLYGFSPVEYGHVCSLVPSWFRRIKRRQDRNRAKDAIRKGKDPLPIKNRVLWEWW